MKHIRKTVSLDVISVDQAKSLTTVGLHTYIIETVMSLTEDVYADLIEVIAKVR